MILRKLWITTARTQETDASSIGNIYGRARRAKRKGAKKLRQFLKRLLRIEDEIR